MGGRRGGGRRGPSPDDEAIWRAFTRDVTPLGDRATRRRPPEPAIPPAAEARPSESALPASPRHPTPADRLMAVEVAPAGRGGVAGLDRRTAERFRRGRMPIEGTLDLHGMTQDRALEALSRFLAASEAHGRRCVLVITGKGQRRSDAGQGPFETPRGGVLRASLPEWLSSGPGAGRVLSYAAARPEHGGAGAFYVLLRRRR